MIIQRKATTDFILQSLGESMGRKIEFTDLLFEGNTSDLIDEKNNKKKRRKKKMREENRYLIKLTKWTALGLVVVVTLFYLI